MLPSSTMSQPSAMALRVARIALAPWWSLTAPHFRGLDNVPVDRPVLLVGNHTLMGLLDVPLMVVALFERRGVRVRPLGDHVHFLIPGWRDFLRVFGTVEGTREACAALMRAGESILVFPGGAREVYKRRGEQYRLLWGDRTGFARLAIEHGYPIVPFATVGADDCYDILVDAGDVLRAVPFLRRLPRAEELPPLVRGVGPTVLPRPQRFYFAFGAPIETEYLRGLESNVRVCRALRDQVRAAIDTGIASLLLERERDPDRYLAARLLRRFLPAHATLATGVAAPRARASA